MGTQLPSPRFPGFWPMSIVAKRSPISATAEHLLAFLGRPCRNLNVVCISGHTSTGSSYLFVCQRQLACLMRNVFTRVFACVDVWQSTASVARTASVWHTSGSGTRCRRFNPATCCLLQSDSAVCCQQQVSGFSTRCLADCITLNSQKFKVMQSPRNTVLYSVKSES